MKELVALVGSAKSVIDNGFSRVGRRLDAASPADRALVLLSARAVSLADALTLLALHQHANEALPLLRSLIDLALHARWIAAQDSGARARRFLDERREADWQSAWDARRLSERARGAEALAHAASYQDHLHANAAGLPWSHLFGDAGAGVGPEALLRETAAAMGHVVAALERRWPGGFEGAERLLQERR